MNGGDLRGYIISCGIHYFMSDEGFNILQSNAEIDLSESFSAVDLFLEMVVAG